MTRVAVIGAGVSGLFAIKSCLEEKMDVCCFERSDQLGGIWVYRENDNTTNSASVYQGLRTNTSTYNNEASDYPNETVDQFPSWDQQLHYVQRLARHFNLDRYIKFNHEVLSVVPDEDGWFVTWKDNDGKTERERFPAVLVCTGRFHTPIVPLIPGNDDFQGECFHANRFKHKGQKNVAGKRVLVVGNSFTAADISAIIADSAKQVYLSVGDKGCSLTSVTLEGVGLDTLATNRGTIYRSRNPLQEFTIMMKRAYDHAFPDQEEYGIKLYSANQLQRPNLYTSHDLPKQIRQKRVKVKPLVTRLTATEAQFSDGTSAEVDTVITATGYDIDFPFLSDDIVADTVSDLELYKLMWPLTTVKPNLAFIGCFKIIGTSIPFCELQARWAAQVIKGHCKLPPIEEMKEEIRARTEAVTLWFGKSLGQTEAPVLIYQDFMASQIGALPTWWHYLLRGQFTLACILSQGPAFPCTYRLVGPHARPKEAAQRTLQLYDRWTRQRRRPKSWKRTVGLMTLGSAAVALAAFYINKYQPILFTH